MSQITHEITNNDTLYISGPMSGMPLFNRPLFEAAEYILKRKYNCVILNPARHPDNLPYTEYMRRAMYDIESANTVILLPGFEQSTGALIEKMIAEKTKKNIYKLNISMEALQ